MGPRFWAVAAFLMAALCLMGCLHAPKSSLTLEMVGPVAGIKKFNLTGGVGELITFSQTEDINDGGITYIRHTAYSIEDEAGKTVREIPNRAGPTDQQPTTVRLAPGRYVVRARAEGFGLIAAPVLIAPNQLTALYLDRHPRPKDLIVPEDEKVLLPDGLLVGRRARR